MYKWTMENDGQMERQMDGQPQNIMPKGGDRTKINSMWPNDAIDSGNGLLPNGAKPDQY